MDQIQVRTELPSHQVSGKVDRVLDFVLVSEGQGCPDAAASPRRAFRDIFLVNLTTYSLLHVLELNGPEKQISPPTSPNSAMAGNHPWKSSVELPGK